MKRLVTSLFISMSVIGAAFACANAALIPVAFAYESPGKPTGFVNDFASIFSVTEKQDLETKLSQFNTDTGTEIAVVSIKALGTETIETYATKLFEEWGIGKKGRDNGLLILIAPHERALRIEVGYGLEGIITDAEAFGIIRDTISPAFKKGQYYTGVSGAIAMIISKITTESAGELAPSETIKSSHIFSDPVFYYFGFMIMWFLIALFAKTKSWWLGGVLGFVVGYIFSTMGVAIVVAIIGLIIDFIVSRNRLRIEEFLKNHTHIFLSGGRGGGFGGGFGGFGGGRSGGGGSSGSW